MTDPIPFVVTRFRCPCCPRTASSKTRMRLHIGRCWNNPEARGCKTCEHFDAPYNNYGDSCMVGVDLTGRPLCERCGGGGVTVMGLDAEGGGGVSECGECAGDGEEIKPGPIVGCDKWEMKTDE